MGESPRRSVRTAAELRDAINTALDAVVIVTVHAEQGKPVLLDAQLRDIMLSIDEYTDHLRNQWLEHHAGRLTVPTTDPENSPATVAKYIGAPVLVYVHSDGDTMTAVDHAPVRSNPRERAISRALILEALRLLEDTP